MAKYLVIVESPTKARTLKRYLGNDFEIEASMGHLRDLPKSKLGVKLDQDFEPDYELVKGKGKVVASLKKAVKDKSDIFLAMDPDREGEAIAWHVMFILQKGKGRKHVIETNKFKRVTFHEITKEAILKAMEKPGVVKADLVDAQQARRVLDRLVGYKLSPMLWKKVRRGLSAGRVQSVALRMIVEREQEIEKFKPQEYWQIGANLQTKDKESEFEVQLYEVEGKKIEVKGQVKNGRGVIYLDSEKVVKPIVSDLEKAKYWVDGIEKKERKGRPYPPYITSTLQRVAANKLGWSGRQTMRIAQQLYEAGLITYHRTDSVSLSKQAISQARDYVKTEYGEKYLPVKPNFYKTKSKSAQEAHEAIRPTKVKRENLEDFKHNGFTKKNERLYRLIWQRFVACQMSHSIYDQTKVEVLAKGKKEYRLKTLGKIMKFDGWRVVYGKKQGEDVLLPELKKEDGLKLKELLKEQKFTQPPARYNDASLVKELEKQGIGRPSTYASIISVLEDRGYVEREERRFVPTSVGITVVKFLKKYFTQVMDYDFTAEMEEDLDRIARGEKEWQKVMKLFWGPFEKKLKEVEEKAKRVEIPVEKTGDKCPTCKKGEVVIRTGRFGKFLSCSEFPECKYTASYTESLDGFKCPDCAGEVVVKRTRRGRMFYGCSNYPECNWASWKDPRGEKDGK